LTAVLQVLLLALIQGLTEFLPVSSSGHLVLAQQLLNQSLQIGNHLVLDVALHLGTLVPVLWFYRHDLVEVSRRTLDRASPKGGDARRYIMYIVAASVPTAIIGLGFEDQFKALFSSTSAVGVALLITGALLVASRVFEAGIGGKPTAGSSLTTGLSLPIVLAIGLAQGLAITPGISRSGATIAVALMLGVPRSQAARFSFLLSVPAIGGAALMELTDAGADLQLGLLAIGFTAAALVGYGALWMLVKLVDGGRLWMFAPYVVLLGLIAIVFG